MAMTRTRTSIFGFFAAWPFIIIFIAIVVMSVTRFEPPPGFIAAWIVMTAIYAVGWIAYLWNVFHNERVPRDKRALWTAILLLGGPYAMPFYFWHYLRETT